LISKQRKQA